MRSKKKRICGIVAICFTIFLFSQAVLATPSESEIIDVLSHNTEYFQQNDWFGDILRSLGWWLVSFLRTICVMAEELYLYCFKLLTFSTSDNIQNLISSMQPMYHAILLLSITAVGLMLMLFNSKFPNFLRSILLTVAIVTCSFYIISQLNKALYDTETDTGLVTWAIGENHTVANDVVNANITDLLYVDQKEENGLMSFSKDNIENYHYPELTDEMFNSIRVRETLNYKDEQLSEEGKELLKKRLKVTADATFTLGDVKNGWGWNSEGDDDTGNEFYYRYHVNYPICILTLFAFVAVYIAMSFVVVKIIINLVIGQILSILYSADLTGSKKTWMILNTMKDGYIALFLTALSVRIYTLFQAWLNDLFVDHGMVNAIILVLLAFAIISGPSIIEKVTGQNVGVSGGLGMMYAAKQAIHGAASIPGHLASAGKTLANGFGWAADKAVKPMPGTPSSFSSNGTGLPDNGKDMPGLPNSPNNPSGGGGSGSASVRNTGENQSGNNLEGLQKEHGLEAEMKKMSNATSAQGKYDSMIESMNEAPSELQDDSIAKKMQENLNKESTDNLDEKPEQLDGAMQKMSQGTQELGEKDRLNMATSDLDNIMKEMQGNQGVSGEKSSLNEATSGLDNTMKEMQGNQGVSGEKSSLNETTSGLDNTMKEMQGNQGVSGEKSSLNETNSGLDNTMKEMQGNQRVSGEKSSLNETTLGLDNTMKEMQGNQGVSGEKSSLNETNSGLENSMKEMPGNQRVSEKKSSLNEASSGLENNMKEMSGSQGVSEAKSSLNEATSGLDNTVKEVQGNQTVTGENPNRTSDGLGKTMQETSGGISSNTSSAGTETLEGTRTIEQGSSLDGSYSMYGSNSNDLSSNNVNNLNPANTGAGASIAEMQRQLRKAKKIDEELKDTLMDE